MSDSEKTLQEKVIAASASKAPLVIVGGDTKSFYGRLTQGDPLGLSTHHGIVDYDPTELVLTARAGTKMTEIIQVLSKNGQMLGFEPPLFGEDSTLGGVVASGLAGPARPFYGSLRDFVLGIKVLSGTGKIMSFGGRVMKNVAGFDVSRLMVGAMGTLGVILEVSLKVLPKPEKEITIGIEQTNPDTAILLMNALRAKPWPMSGAAWFDNKVFIRFSGSEAVVKYACENNPGEPVLEGNEFWAELRDHKHAFFQGDLPLVRGAVKPGAKRVELSITSSDQPDPVPASLIEWAGAVRWYRLGESGKTGVSQINSSGFDELGGHVSCFRGGDRSGQVFTPLTGGVLTIHKNLKKTFDPHQILNPGRLYADL